MVSDHSKENRAPRENSFGGREGQSPPCGRGGAAGVGPRDSAPKRRREGAAASLPDNSERNRGGAAGEESPTRGSERFSRAPCEKRNGGEGESGRRSAPAEGVVVGRSAVMELLASGAPVEKLYLQKGAREGSITLIESRAIAAGLPVVEVGREALDRLSGGLRHQGVAAVAGAKETVSLEDILKIAEDRGEPPFLLLADGVEDPGNLGALIRSAEGAGAHGIVIPKRRGAPLGAAAARSSAGALSHIAVSRVPGIPAALDKLKRAGVWIFGADMDGDDYGSVDFSGPAALVVGGEGRGLSHLTREKCDFLVSIPMYGKVNSLNVSCAAAVLLCEAARQRHGK